jgi:hypothetical protein
MIAGVVAVGGCGTVANLQGKRLPAISQVHVEEPRPFGGIGRDVRWISSGGVIFVADLPLSLIGDVVTLPMTLSPKSRAAKPTGSSEQDSPETDLREQPQSSISRPAQ